MMLPSPLTDTELPKASPAAPSEAVSVTRAGAAVPHPPEGLVNTYAAPAFVPPPSLACAPTTTVPPSALADTDPPNKLPPSKSEASSRDALVVVSSQPVAGFVKMCARPYPAIGAVAATVLPSALTDTEYPSCWNGSERRSLAAMDVSAHPSVGRVNT